MFRSLCMHVNVWMCMRGRFYFLMAKPFSVFYSKTGFWPSYRQISADLDKILHTPNVVQNTFVRQLRPRSAPGRLQAKSKRLFFCNTCNGKQSKWMWGRVLLWKIPEFCNVGRARSKILELPCAQPTGNSFTPNQWYQWKAETLKVCLFL